MAITDTLDAARDEAAEKGLVLDVWRTIEAAYRGARSAMSGLAAINAALGATAPADLKAEGVAVWQKLETFVQAMEAEHGELLAWRPTEEPQP